VDSTASSPGTSDVAASNTSPEPVHRASDPQTRDGANAPQADGVRGRVVWGDPLPRLLLVALVLLATAMAIVAPTALRVKGISLFDEPTHLDYAYELAHGHVPAAGSYISPAIRDEIVCRGPASRKVQLTQCGTPAPHYTTRTGNNQNYNFSHPPLYYGITGVLTRAGSVVWRGAHFVSIARLLGIFWLFAGMFVSYLGLRKLNVNWLIAACGAELLAFTPAIFYLDSTVTNDAAAALCGGATIWLVGRIFVDRKLGLVVPFVLSALMAATKILNALPILALAVLLFVLAIRERRTSGANAKRMGLLGAVSVAGTLAVYLVWTFSQNHRGDPNWVNPIKGISGRPLHGSPFDELFSTTFSGANLLSYGYLPPQLTSDPMTIFLRLLGPLAAGCAVAVLALNRPLTARWMVAGAGALGALTFPLLVEIQVWISSNEYFPHVVLRYGVSLVPLLIASIAIAADDKKLKRTMVFFTLAAAFVALYTVYNPLNGFPAPTAS
jgi:hypothetical protein